MKALLDNSVMALAVIANAVSFPIEGMFNKLALYQAKPEPVSNKKKELFAINSIASASQNGSLELWMDHVVRIEAMNGRAFPSINEVSLLENVSPRYAPLPQEPWFSCINLGSKESTIRSVEALVASRKGMGGSELPESIRTLKSICHSLHRNHYCDALILLAGVMNKIDYFVTCDKKFRNALSTNRSLNILTKVISPSDLVIELKLPEGPPLPFEFGKRYMLSGAEYK